MKPGFRLRIPILLKVGGITTALLMAVGISLTLASMSKLESNALSTENRTNKDQLLSKTNEVEGLITNYRDKIRIVATLLLKDIADHEGKSPGSALDSFANHAGDAIPESLKLSFQEDRDLVNLEIYRLKDGKTELVKRITQDRFLKENAVSEAYFEQLRTMRPFPISSVFARNVEIQNSSVRTAGMPAGIPLITIGEGLVEDDSGQTTFIAVADIRLDRIQNIFSKVTERTFFLVDKLGRVIAHPNDQWVFDARDMIVSDIVKRAINSKSKSEQHEFVEPDSKQPYIGAFARTSYGASAVVQVSREVIDEPVRNVRRTGYFMTAKVISLAFFLVFLLSMNLTSPIEKLVAVTRAVADGNFDVKSEVHSHDEVGELAESFDTMIAGLRERDKMRNVLNKFHGSHVTDDLLKGDLQLGGSNREVTVFFSDIRGFTAFSEGNTPEEVVGMLNEYFAIMVSIITANHGIVDKFVGDAIMAVWGAPNSSGDDPAYALKACLEMRKALDELNQRRSERGKVEIKIGMGLHTGRAISGTIGSNERMEYTVIGDTVNLAARIEAATKAFGTDLLVSESIRESASSKFIYDFAGAAEVKGKEAAIRMFKVRGYVDEQGHAVIIRTKYSDYESSDADKVKVVPTAS